MSEHELQEYFLKWSVAEIESLISLYNDAIRMKELLTALFNRNVLHSEEVEIILNKRPEWECIDFYNFDLEVLEKFLAELKNILRMKKEKSQTRNILKDVYNRFFK